MLNLKSPFWQKLDQWAHRLIGSGAILLVMWISAWLIIPLVIGAVLFREYEQHQAVILWNEDLLNWYLGIAIAVVISIFFSFF